MYYVYLGALGAWVNGKERLLLLMEVCIAMNAMIPGFSALNKKLERINLLEG